MPGVASYYEVKFTDTNKPVGQIWAGVVGTPTEPGTPRGQRTPERWFVGLVGHREQPDPQGRGRDAGQFDPAVQPAAASAAAGPERATTAAGSQCAATATDPNAPPPDRTRRHRGRRSECRSP